MLRLTVATLNLGEGRRAEVLPDLVSQAGDVDLFFVQAGKGWHRDGQRTRYRAEWLLASIGLDRCLMTVSTRGPLDTLIFWRANRMYPVAHYDAVRPDVPGEQDGLAEFAVGGFAPVVNTLSVQWATSSGDHQLDEAQQLTRFAAPDAVTIIAGDFDSLWPDCAGHREFEPARHAPPPHMRHRQTLASGARPDGTVVADRRAVTVLAEAGFRSAGCIAGVMTPTVDDKPDTGPGGRVDHIVVSPSLAGCVIASTYAVHVSRVGNRSNGHRLVSVSLDLDQFPPESWKEGRERRPGPDLAG